MMPGRKTIINGYFDPLHREGRRRTQFSDNIQEQRRGRGNASSRDKLSTTGQGGERSAMGEKKGVLR